ncbi:alpha/beta hydrolase [Nocardia otitidiscaviarum]|nr:alpha/beta fold hydrolase [Nocardia otitidiscaviarum]MCP9622740.1 alpha/beta hydrolase [Nocardia otitidiscaviarum]
MTGLTAVTLGTMAAVSPPAAAESRDGLPAIAPGTTVTPAIDCAPSAEHPYPVVVLPGGDGTVHETADQWATIVDALNAAGYCTLLFQGGVVNETRWAGDIPSGARQLADFITEVRETTGAERVDIVAHSAGTVVANYFLKVLGGAPRVAHAVLLTPEARGCDGRGSLRQLGIDNLPVAPVEILRALPILAPALAPSMGNALQLSPLSDVYHAVFDGPIAQPGVEYSVLSTRNDEVATPATVCTVIDEPGVTMAFYEDRFPDAPAVGHSTIRSSALTAGWILTRLTS